MSNLQLHIRDTNLGASQFASSSSHMFGGAAIRTMAGVATFNNNPSTTIPGPGTAVNFVPVLDAQGNQLVFTGTEIVIHAIFSPTHNLVLSSVVGPGPGFLLQHTATPFSGVNGTGIGFGNGPLPLIVTQPAGTVVFGTGVSQNYLQVKVINLLGPGTGTIDSGSVNIALVLINADGVSGSAQSN